MRKPDNKGTVRLDFTGVEPGSGGFRCEPGEYLAECVSVKQEESSQGNPMLTWDFQLKEGAFKGRRLRFWTPIVPQAMWKLRDTLQAFGHEIPSSAYDLDLRDLVGTYVNIVVEDDLYEGKTRSKIAEVLAADTDEEPEADDEIKPVKSKRAKVEDVPFEEESEEEPPAKIAKSAKRQTEKLTPLDIDAVREMQDDQLKAIIVKYGLSCDLSEHKTLRRKQAAVMAALEDSGMLVE